LVRNKGLALGQIWNNGIMECWNNGIMEKWLSGEQGAGSRANKSAALPLFRNKLPSFLKRGWGRL